MFLIDEYVSSSDLYLWTFCLRDISQSGDILQSLLFVDQKVWPDIRKYFGKGFPEKFKCIYV